MKSAKFCLKCGGPVRVARSREAAGATRRRLHVCPHGHRYTTIEIEESALAERDQAVKAAAEAVAVALTSALDRLRAVHVR